MLGTYLTITMPHEFSVETQTKVFSKSELSIEVINMAREHIAKGYFDKKDVLFDDKKMFMDSIYRYSYFDRNNDMRTKLELLAEQNKHCRVVFVYTNPTDDISFHNQYSVMYSYFSTDMRYEKTK